MPSCQHGPGTYLTARVAALTASRLGHKTGRGSALKALRMTLLGSSIRCRCKMVPGCGSEGQYACRSPESLYRVNIRSKFPGPPIGSRDSAFRLSKLGHDDAACGREVNKRRGMSAAGLVFNAAYIRRQPLPPTPPPSRGGWWSLGGVTAGHPCTRS